MIMFADHSEDDSHDEEDRTQSDNKKQKTDIKDTTYGSEHTEQKVTGEDLKKKSDSLWEEFRKDLPNPLAPDEANDANTSSNSLTDERQTKTLVTKTYDFAGEEIKVTEEVANTSKASCVQQKTSDDHNIESKGAPVKAVKRTGGLGSVLSQLKKPKMSTLQKSFIDWNDFKKWMLLWGMLTLWVPVIFI